MNDFASRGGIKLQAAFENFKLNIENYVVLDVGSSTGGFVDCLLQNGAKKVYAVDTCYGELAWKLRNDSRVVVMERTNILHLEHLPDCYPVPFGLELRVERLDTGSIDIDSGSEAGMTKDVGGVDLITIDAGWTKLELVLPVVKKFLKPEGIIIALLKPHYESQKQFKGGVVPEQLVESIKYKVLREIENLGFKVKDVIESPILGGAGNKEYLLLLKQK